MKQCSRCREEKPLEGFYSDRSKRDGRHTVCKECVKKDRRDRYAADPQKHKDRMKQWQAENRDKIRDARWKRKLAVIERYGGRCACCGESTPEFMTVDHIGGWGKDHRAESGLTYNMVAYLYARPILPGFRILCFNCNCSLGMFGRCPHQEEVS